MQGGNYWATAGSCDIIEEGDQLQAAVALSYPQNRDKRYLLAYPYHPDTARLYSFTSGVVSICGFCYLFYIVLRSLTGCQIFKNLSFLF